MRSLDVLFNNLFIDVFSYSRKKENACFYEMLNVSTETVDMACNGAESRKLQKTTAGYILHKKYQLIEKDLKLNCQTRKLVSVLLVSFTWRASTNVIGFTFLHIFFRKKKKVTLRRSRFSGVHGTTPDH